MAKKPKTILTNIPLTEGPLAMKVANALNNKYGPHTTCTTPFTFDVVNVIVGDDQVLCITADGPWHLPGNERPAHGTMQTFGEGYLQCLRDNDDAAPAESPAPSNDEGAGI